MKKFLLGLALILILGCTDKTDKNGFYIEGKNIGIHKETKTKYDINGYDINGYDKDNFGKDGWSKNKNINKETKTKYDKDGYDYYGFNKDKINRDTGTNYNIDGWDKDGFNKKGINKITGFNFNERGYTQEIFFYNKGLFTKKMIEKPYVFFLNSMSDDKKEYFMTEDDKFEGITYMGKSYNYDLSLLALTTSSAKRSMEIAKKTQKSADYKKAYEYVDEVLEMIKGKFYIDIITNYSPDDKVKSFFTFTFFSPEKQHNLKSIELLVNENIVKIDNYLFDSNNIEIDYSFHSEKLPLYLNQVKIPVTDNLFDLFAKMEKNKTIEVRVLNNEDNRFMWTNKIEKNKGLAIGLGRHYKMENLKDKDRKHRIF